MSAVRDFPLHTNPHAFAAGLILMPDDENDGISCPESGLREGTLKFYCRNDREKNFTPVRGTPCSDFICGDGLTKRILRDLAYLGAQRSKFTPDGAGEEIGILEVAVQGGIFTDNSKNYGAVDPVDDEDDPITKPWRTESSSRDTVSVVAYQKIGSFYIPTYNVSLDYYAPDLRFEYVARDRAPGARFVKEEYAFDESGLVVLDAEGTKVKIFVKSSGGTTARTSAAGGSILIDPGTPADIPQTIWQPWVKVIGTAAQFDQNEAGQYWHVIETVSLKLQAVTPASGFIGLAP